MDFLSYLLYFEEASSEPQAVLSNFCKFCVSSSQPITITVGCDVSR